MNSMMGIRIKIRWGMKLRDVAPSGGVGGGGALSCS